MYQVNKKIPTNNINEALMRCYELLCEKFPALTLDNRPELRGNNNAIRYSVYYKAVLKDGRERDMTESYDSLHRTNPMYIGNFLWFVRRNNPEKIIKTVNTNEWMRNPDDYEQVDFYDRGVAVTVKPHKGFFGGCSVKLEIEMQEQQKAKVQSIIDELN